MSFDEGDERLTFREWINEELSDFTGGKLSLDDLEHYEAKHMAGIPARDVGMDTDYDDGYGGHGYESHFIGWSNEYVYYLHEYDGSSRICRVPRNPPTTPGDES